MPPIYHPYPKISETLPEKGLEINVYKTLMKTQWIQCEKIHGAHFCLLYTSDQLVHCAKRRTLLKPLETFFNHHQVVAELYQKVLHLGQMIQNDYPDLTSIQIHGELFGGEYPHPQIESIAKITPIQTGVYYSPSIHFFAFDLFVCTPQQNQFLSYTQLIEYCEQTDFPYLPYLIQGKFSELCTLSSEFQTTLPSLFGLPPLENNLAEGFILRPIQPFSYVTNKGIYRIIAKYKNTRFKEDPKYHQAQAWGNSQLTLEDFEQLLIHWITLNRVNSARSKVGDQSPLKELVEEVSKDIWNDFSEEYPIVIQYLSTDEVEWLHLWLDEQIIDFIKMHPTFQYPSS